MPIEIKDFTWKQSNDSISICVPLRGIHCSHVDIQVSTNFIKLHFTPFIFEVFLRHDIDESTLKCYLTDKEAFLEITKVVNGDWDKLEADIDKKEKVALKLRIIEGIQVKTRKALDDQIKLKARHGKFAVSEAIALDTKRRSEVDAKRDVERNNAMNDLENYRQSKAICSDTQITQSPTKHNLSNEIGVIIRELKDVENSIARGDYKSSLPKNSSVIKQAELKKSNFYEKVISDIETRSIPAPRQTSTLGVSFTERIFPTPCRESSAQDEEIWLKNITEARRATGFVSEDLRPEEQDPVWCKEKGDSFFKAGNYLGAISAYSHGIKLSSKLPALYTNRSICQFAVGNFNKCIEDCSEALDLMKPHCASNLHSRVKCIARRAAALTRVGMLNKAIGEMKAAIRLEPHNQDLTADLNVMERAWEQDPDSD